MSSVDLERNANGNTWVHNFYVESQSGAERGYTPWIIPMIIVANVAVFIVVMGFNNCPAHPKHFGSCTCTFLHRFSFQPLRENSLFGPSSSTYSFQPLRENCLVDPASLRLFGPFFLWHAGLGYGSRLQRLGALEWDKVVHQHQGWRLVTCFWLHAGVCHLLPNMLFLGLIGICFEQQFGYIRIGIIYLISGFGCSILSSLFSRNTISVGASGALFGLIGARLSELFTNWTIHTNKTSALLILLVIIGTDLALGISPHVDNFGHIGGVLTGFLLGFVLLMRPQFGWIEHRSLPPASQVKSKHKVYQYVLCVIGLLLLIAGFVVGLVMLFRGENLNDRCHWCHYLSCVPPSRQSCGN